LTDFGALEFFNIRKIRLEKRRIMAHIEGAYQVEGSLYEKIFF